MARGNKPTEITKQQEEDFISLYNEGLSLEVISRKIGLSSWTVQKFAVKLRTEGKIQQRGNVMCQWNSEKDKKLLDLKNQGHSWSDIAALMNMGKSTVQTRYHRILKPGTEKEQKEKKKPRKLWEIEAEARRKGLTYGQYVGGDEHSRI